MLCLVRYLFVISTSVIDCLGRFVPVMTCYVSSGTLNFAQLNSTNAELATCVNYAEINNSMLRMRGHVSVGFFVVNDVLR